MAIIIPRKRNTQPQGILELNPQHWLADDLLFVHPLSGPWALVNGKPTAPLVNTLPISPIGGVRGNSTELAAVSDAAGYLSYPIPETVDGHGYTMSAWAWEVTNGAIEYLLSMSTAGAQGAIALGIANASDLAQVVSVTNTGSSAIATTTGDVANSEWHHLCGVIASATSRTAYSDGTSSSTNTTARSAPALSVVTVGGYLVNGTISSLPESDTRISLPMIIRRVLTADEVARLYQEQLSNPWEVFREHRHVLYFSVGGGATTVSPSIGAATYAGNVPAITQGAAVSPSIGAVSYAGSTPAISQPQTVAPAIGAATYAGNVPAISQPQTVAPTIGAATYAGNVPAITQGASVSPSIGAVSYAGNVPAISQPQTVAPTIGAVTYAGNVPEVFQSTGVRPSIGAVTVLGAAPTIGQPITIAPAIGSYDILGNTPTVSQAALVTPTTGQIIVLGGVPGITQPRTVAPVIGGYVLLGKTPTVGLVEGLVLYGVAGVRVYHTVDDAAVRQTVEDALVMTVTPAVRVVRLNT